jgi:hypothetical protein
MTDTTGIEVDATFGHWRVLRVAHRRALCRCRCGQVHEVAIAALQDGTSTSCGCSTPPMQKLHDLREERHERERKKIFAHWQPGRGR